jgi:hypothetical protein
MPSSTSSWGLTPASNKSLSINAAISHFHLLSKSLVSAASLAVNATMLSVARRSRFEARFEGDELHIVRIDHHVVMIDPEPSFRAHAH